MKRMAARSVPLVIAMVLFLLCGCSGGGGGGGSTNGGNGVSARQIAAVTGDYILVAWNDLGMHCLNPSYDTAVILPPYNTVWAQVIKRGNPPQVVTAGVTVDYRLVNNTTSANKGNFGQFWTYVQKLFGVTLNTDRGLNLADPTISNGLSGSMVASGDHFQVNGIPATPIDDDGTWNPYQVAEITAKIAGVQVAQTRTTVPTSDEIHCDKCHLPSAANNNSAFLDILQKHDLLHTPPDGLLVPSKPVLCAGCHGSPALGLTTPGDSGKFLSAAIHGAHATRTAPDGSAIACYDCHPGTVTQCNRSNAHTTANGNCTTCHGTMQQVADSINSGARVPWVNEPKCATCHGQVAEVDTGDTLYRNAIGHGGVYCAGCHGSPHTMYPSRQSTDNYQPLQYQSVAKSLGSCGVCHSGSRGGGSGEFLQSHGSGTRPSACSVCHTGFNSADTANWPHRFQWRSN